MLLTARGALEYDEWGQYQPRQRSAPQNQFIKLSCRPAIMFTKIFNVAMVEIEEHFGWHLLGALTAKMHHLGFRNPINDPAGALNSIAQVYFFGVNKIILVQKSNLFQDLFSQQQAGTC